jgi:uracil-DNA glycosylase family 4
MSLSTVRQEIIKCERCARLRDYCARIAREKKPAHREDVYWGKPVPGFGDPEARLLVLGLAPAAHGANRTGRVFTGDGSGDFLMNAMHRAGFASIPTSRRPDDGLELRGAYIAAAVRCAPPDNKPTLEELITCKTHLESEVAALPRLRVVVALGKIAFDAWWRVMEAKGIVIRPRPVFVHGLRCPVDGWPTVIASYHPSRQNTNTRKLTAPMLERIFQQARRMSEGSE